MALTGKHPGTLTGQGSVYEKPDNGSLICCLIVNVGGSDLKYHFTLLTTADGVKEKTVANLKSILPEWSGDIGELFDIVSAGEYAGREVEADCEPREYNNKTYTSIKWLNPPGGGTSVPQSTDKSALLKKYGAKFRAISPQKPKPAAPPTVTPTFAPKPAAPKPKPATKAAVEPSSAEACWSAINAVMEGKPDDEVQAKWYEIIGGESVDTSAWDGQKWGEILLAINKLGDQIPY